MSMESLEVRRILKSIRRLSSGFPEATAGERLEKIKKIAAREISPDADRPAFDPGLLRRIADGQASRSPRVSAGRKQFPDLRKTEDDDIEKVDKTTGKKKREKKGGRDRKESGGETRETVNIQTSKDAHL